MATTCKSLLNKEGNLPDEMLPSFYKQMMHTIFEVWNEREDGTTSGGTGVCVSPQGHILTCFHVIDKNKKISVSSLRTDVTDVVIIEVDKLKDLALLHLTCPSDIPYVKFCGAKYMTIGMRIISVAHPAMLSYTLTVGELAYPFDEHTFRTWGELEVNDDEQKNKLSADLQLMQVNNCHVKGGASGGPIFNSAGYLVGLACLIYKKAADLFIPSSLLKSFVAVGIQKDGTETSYKRPKKSVSDDSFAHKVSKAVDWTAQVPPTTYTKKVRAPPTKNAEIAEACIHDVDDMCDNIRGLNEMVQKLLGSKTNDGNVLSVKWTSQVSPTVCMTQIGDSIKEQNEMLKTLLECSSETITSRKI